MSTIQASHGTWSFPAHGTGYEWPRRTNAQGSPSLLREPVTRSIELAMLPELACMTRFLGRTTRNRELSSVRRRLRALLDTIEALIVEGEIQPWQSLRLSEDDAPCAGSTEPIRLGVYPVRADPIHWGHIFHGLSAMASARLDKVVYVVVDNGCDEQGLLPKELRCCTACDLLKSFEPLLCYSPVGRECDTDAESSVFRLLALNPERKIDAFYIGDADMDAPTDGKGASMRREHAAVPDKTIKKLESGVLRQIYRDGGYGSGAHSLSLIFVTGNPAADVPDTFLPMRFIPAPAPELSVGSARNTIMGDRNSGFLAALPYSVFRQIQGAAR